MNELTITKEQQELAEEMAREAGENTNTYQIMPTLTVFNQNFKNPNPDFQDGDLKLTTKTEAGYEHKKYMNPFSGIILKVRMYMKTKSSDQKAEEFYTTDEFDHYMDSGVITVKKKNEQGKFDVAFTGNYKQVKETFPDFELHHVIYVLASVPNREIIKLDIKGASRNEFIKFQKSFTRRDGDHMIASWTTIGSKMTDEDWQGNKLRFSVAAMTFEKKSRLNYQEMISVREIQKEFNIQLAERDAMFKKPIIAQVEEQKSLNDGSQPARAEELPTINLDDEIDESTLFETEKEPF